MAFNLGDKVFCEEKGLWGTVMREIFDEIVEIKFEEPNVSWGDNRWNVKKSEIHRIIKKDLVDWLPVGTPVNISHRRLYRNKPGFVVSNKLSKCGLYLVATYEGINFEIESYHTYPREGFSYTLHVTPYEKVVERRCSNIERKCIKEMMKEAKRINQLDNERKNKYEKFLDDISSLTGGNANEI